MNAIWQDLRGGVRGLRRSPTLTGVAILTIALGIGVNTTMFSIVDAVLLRPLPFSDPDRLVVLKSDLPGLSLSDAGFSVPEIDDLAQRSGIFDQLSGTWVIDANITGGQRPERIVLLAAHATYFQILGATAQVGRVLGPQDDAAGFAESIVISDAAWHRLFGRDPSAIGRQIRIDTDLYTIVGVMPAGFHHPAAASVPNVDAWAASGFRADPFPSEPSRRVRMLPGAIARLKPGISVQQAGAALDTFAASIRHDYPGDYPENARWSIRAEPLRDLVVGDVHPILLALSGAVALILLIGCANVANLLLARSSTRQREMAIRLAVGAGRGRLIRQLLTENLVLAAAGGLAGLLAALATQSLLLAMLPAELPRVHEIGIHRGVLLFGAAITVLTSLLFGIAPAWQASRTRPAAAMIEGGRGASPSARQRRLRTVLVTAEIALSLVLLTGAGLLLKTVSELLKVETGFESSRVLLARSWIAVPNNPDADRYRTTESRAALAREMVRRLHAIPEVTSAAITSALPVSHMATKQPVQIEGRPNEADATTSELVMVSPEYFSALQIPLMHGRTFTEGDDSNTQQVAVIDEAAAIRFFPGVDAIGKRIQVGRAGPRATPVAATIVGIVGNAKYDGLDEDVSPHVYVSWYQRSGRGFGIVVKAKTDPDLLHDSVRRAIEGADADLPIFGTQSLDSKIAQSIGRQRFSAQAVTSFALLALLLAAVGVYGVMAYAIETRTHEIGVRMALGATPRAVLTSVLKDGLRTALAGITIGLALSIGATRFIQTMLYDVSPGDPGVFAACSVLLVIAALLASYLPARRAASVDPLMSFRRE